MSIYFSNTDSTYTRAEVEVSLLVCWLEKEGTGIHGLFIVHEQCGGIVLTDPRPSDFGPRLAKCPCGYLINPSPNNVEALSHAAEGRETFTIRYVGNHSTPVKTVYKPMPKKVKRHYLRQGLRALLRVRELEEAGREFAETVGETRSQFKSLKLQYAREKFEYTLNGGAR